VGRLAVAKIKGTRRKKMAKMEGLRDREEHELVGVLTWRSSEEWLMRTISPEGKVYYYFVVSLDSDEVGAFIEAIDKTKKGENGYPTPSITEEMIVRMVEQGWLFYPSLMGKHHSKEKVGGKRLKDWYEDFIKFFETVQGKSIVWHDYAEFQHALFFTEIPKDEWPDYWALTVWEREELVYRLESFTSAIWKVIWGLIEKVALKLEKRQGKKTFSLQDIVEFLGRRNPLEAIRDVLGNKKLRMGKEQEEWIYSIVWQKLQEAAKEDRTLTLREIRIILGYEEE
jgi:hypothetical protein